MALLVDLQPPRTDISSLERAVLETLAYSDVFDFPLRLDELHRYLTASTSIERLKDCIGQFERIDVGDGFYYIKGRGEIVDLRKQREAASGKAFDRAILYGRILGGLPFIRMVGLTGSLAMLNLTKGADMDYMLVAKSGRLWLARAFALLLNRVAHLFGDKLCPNLIVSENALEWTARNLYSARELCQMIPVCGGDVYSKLRVANKWILGFLPNVVPESSSLSAAKISSAALVMQKIIEFFLRGSFGNYVESWEMTRKIARLENQAGYGLETIFTADICQGNFDHHGSWAMEKYQERLTQLGLAEAEVGAGKP